MSVTAGSGRDHAVPTVVPALGVVVGVALHCANCPRTKSFSVAVVEVDERVSAAMLEKHSSARLTKHRRLTPPS